MVLETKTLEEKARQLLQERGVSVKDITKLVLFLQKKYLPELTLEEASESVDAVLSKREVHNAILTGIQLDILAEEKALIQPLQDIIEESDRKKEKNGGFQKRLLLEKVIE